MADVFVSYASEDRGRIAPLIDAIEAQGLSVWWDRRIGMGSSFDREIERELDAAKCVVVVWSAQSVDSDWVRIEAQEGYERNILVPLRIDDVRPPLAFRRSQTADLVGWPAAAAELEPLLEAIATKVGSRTFLKQPSGKRSATPLIAVLPLENLSGDPAQEYIADGMTEELITELGKLGALGVISRTSVMQYRAKRPSLPEIAGRLGVDWILEGSVAHEAGRFRVTVQLIDARTDTPVWSERFDRQMSSVLALRADVAGAVVGQLPINLPSKGQREHTTSREVDDAAYDAYLRGIHHFGFFSARRHWAPLALGELEKAVALDPNFAQAWAKLATVRLSVAMDGNRDYYPKSREAAEKALSLDSTLGEAHSKLGFVAWLYDTDLEAARDAFERSVELSPNDPAALNGYVSSRNFLERFAEVIPANERLLRVAPLDPYFRPMTIQTFTMARLYERAHEELERVLELWPDYVDPTNAVLMYTKLGRFEDAHRTRMAYLVQRPPSNARRKAVERGWAEGSFEGELRALAEHEAASQTPNPVTVLYLCAEFGDMDQAFEWLERAREPRVTYPFFDALRLDPRFDRFVGRLKLPSSHESPARMADVGRLMAFRGHAPEAISRLDGAMATSPDDPRTPRWLESMAWARFALGEYAEAITWAKRILEHKASSHALAFANLLVASGSAHLERANAANNALAEALALWPRLEIDQISNRSSWAGT